jgi:hypothetical protein
MVEHTREHRRLREEHPSSLSLAGKVGFGLRGYAGNAAPDHVDLLHALPELLAEDTALESLSSC